MIRHTARGEESWSVCKKEVGVGSATGERNGRRGGRGASGGKGRKEA